MDASDWEFVREGVKKMIALMDSWKEESKQLREEEVRKKAEREAAEQEAMKKKIEVVEESKTKTDSDLEVPEKKIEVSNFKRENQAIIVRNQSSFGKMVNKESNMGKWKSIEQPSVKKKHINALLRKVNSIPLNAKSRAKWAEKHGVQESKTWHRDRKGAAKPEGEAQRQPHRPKVVEGGKTRGRRKGEEPTRKTVWKKHNKKQRMMKMKNTSGKNGLKKKKKKKKIRLRPKTAKKKIRRTLNATKKKMRQVPTVAENTVDEDDEGRKSEWKFVFCHGCYESRKAIKKKKISEKNSEVMGECQKKENKKIKIKKEESAAALARAFLMTCDVEDGLGNN